MGNRPRPFLLVVKERKQVNAFLAEEHHAQAVKSDAALLREELARPQGFLAGRFFISSSTHPFNTLLDSLP
jgi:hypothetical protein